MAVPALPGPASPKACRLGDSSPGRGAFWRAVSSTNSRLSADRSPTIRSGGVHAATFCYTARADGAVDGAATHSGSRSFISRTSLYDSQTETIHKRGGRIPRSKAGILWIPGFACGETDGAVSKEAAPIQRKSNARSCKDLAALLELRCETKH